MRVLGIESSCDETAAAVVSGEQVLASLVATQHDVHERFGGVVPELASRRHMENVVPLVAAALTDAELTLDDIDGVAATYAPGLVGSLLVGLMAAKAIAYTRGIPFIGVNHLDGHLNAASLEFGPIPHPHVGLVVSGGHTSLYAVTGRFDVKLLGATRDDAAGEAFDKVAKLLGLGYPGGPAIDRMAQRGDPKAMRFTRPKFSQEGSLDFSFSGIKTACLLKHREESKNGEVSGGFVADMAASFQEAVASFLVERVVEGARKIGAKGAVLAGGVAANRRLRSLFESRCTEEGLTPYIPPMELCTDNAAMIAHVGRLKLEAGERSPLTLNAVANMEIGI